MIICGYGRMGQVLSELLSEQLIPFVAVDASSERVLEGKSSNLPVYFADAGSELVMHALGAERAACVVVALDSPGEGAGRWVIEVACLLTGVARPNVLVRALDRHLTHIASVCLLAAKKPLLAWPQPCLDQAYAGNPCLTCSWMHKQGVENLQLN